MRVGVIGAGMAGLACASRLAQSGAEVTVLDKGRGLGGRLATRRAPMGSFDHGAPKVDATGDLAQWLAGAGALHWPGQGWVGQPGMSALVRPLAEGLAVHTGAEVGAIQSTATGWRLEGQGLPDIAPFDHLVVAIPQPQALRLLPQMRDALAPAAMRPVWTALFAFDAALAGVPDVLAPADGAIALALRESAKPGRAPGERWVVHAADGWTRAHLELDKPEVAAALLAEFRALTGTAGADPVHVDGHRWRFGLTQHALGQPFLRHGTLAICGDWCLGAGAQQAWDSGTALAAALLAA